MSNVDEVVMDIMEEALFKYIKDPNIEDTLFNVRYRVMCELEFLLDGGHIFSYDIFCDDKNNEKGHVYVCSIAFVETDGGPMYIVESNVEPKDTTNDAYNRAMKVV